MRKLTTAIVVAALACTAGMASAKTISIGKNDVNMRTEPSTDAKVVFQLKEGYPLKVLSTKGEWFKVEDFEGDTGWVHKTVAATTKHLIVNHDAANLRGGPAATHESIGTLKYGEVVQVRSAQGNWFKVQTSSGAAGWVNRKLLWGWQ